MSDDTKLAEILDRTRRIETRLSAYLVKQGEEINPTQATWVGPDLHNYSPYITVNGVDCPFSKCLNVVPDGFEDPVPVYVKTATGLVWLATINGKGVR